MGWERRDRDSRRGAAVQILAAETGEQVLGMDGLGQDLEFMALCAGAIEQIGSCGLAGKQKYFAGWEQGADLDSRVDPVHVRHNDVGDEHVRRERFSSLNSFFATIDGCCLEAALIKNDCECICNDAFIVRDKNFWFYLGFRHSFLFHSTHTQTG